MDNKYEQRMIAVLRGAIVILILAGATFSTTGCSKEINSADATALTKSSTPETQAVPMQPAPNTPKLVALIVTFKLDPRLTRGLYMGDRWVSPATFMPAIQQGKKCSIETQAYAMDSWDRQIMINPKWMPENPEMVKVDPAEGPQVTITILDEGQSRLTVTDGELSKTLTVMAEPYRDTLKVTIRQ